MQLLGAFNRDGTPAKAREPSAFAKYVQEHFSVLKASRPDASHRELMASLGEQWRSSRQGVKPVDRAAMPMVTVGIGDVVCEEVDEEEQLCGDLAIALKLAAESSE